MYLEHYGLDEPPFSITPDPRFVFLSERHRDALAHLMFGVGQGGGGGFVQLTGEVGTGKTTLSRLLLEQLPANVRVALVLNPRLDATELLEAICEELHLDITGRRGSPKALVDMLNAHLLEAYAQGLRVVLVVDEAQNLSVEALEQVRLLTNLETDTQKLLQILLLGQPELRDKLARSELRQLAQRITARFHLVPLAAHETADYVRHRFRVAGGHHVPFDAGALERLHLRAGGVPRLINIIAERSLLAGYARDAATIDRRLVDEAADEALPPPLPGAMPRLRHGWLAASAAVASLLVVVAIAAWPRTPSRSEANGRLPVVPVQPARTPASASASGPAVPASPAGHAPASAAAPVPVPGVDAETFDRRIRDAGARPDDAWRSLLQAWRLPDSDADVAAANACAPVLAAATYCLRSQASLDRLLAIGRPALLWLQAGGRGAWALLLGADAMNARLELDGTRIDVPRVLLDAAWNGRYATVWRSAGAPAHAPAAGDAGAAVDWLRARVTPGAAAGQPLEAGFAERVRAFQRAHGLAADGIVGRETLFALAADDPGPRLSRHLD